MTLEDLKSIGLAFGEAKLLKKELEALASPAAPSLPATTSSLAAAGGGAGAGVPAAGGGAAVASSSPPLSSPSLTLDATILSPFISRVMSADDEDLDLRSPIEVRSPRRSTELPCVTFVCDRVWRSRRC